MLILKKRAVIFENQSGSQKQDEGRLIDEDKGTTSYMQSYLPLCGS